MMNFAIKMMDLVLKNAEFVFKMMSAHHDVVDESHLQRLVRRQGFARQEELGSLRPPDQPRQDPGLLTQAISQKSSRN